MERWELPEHTILELMADRVERGDVGHVFGIAGRQCDTCPFRSANANYRRSASFIPLGDWPCHTEDLHGTAGIQCAGHAAAIKRFGAKDATAIRAEAAQRQQPDGLVGDAADTQGEWE